MSVLTTHIVMTMEIVYVIATGTQLLTAIYIVESAGRTVPDAMEMTTPEDVMAQLNMTVTNVSAILIAQSMDTVLVTRTGVMQTQETHAHTTPANVTTDASMDVPDPPMAIV